MFNVGALSAVLVSVILIGLGVLVLPRAGGSLAKRSFAGMCWALALWVVANQFADTTAESSLFWTRMTFFAITLALLAFVFFVTNFPSPSKRSIKLRIPVILTGLIVAVICWLPSFIPEVVAVDGTTNVVTGALYPIFVVYFLAYLIAALWILVKRKRAERRIDRERIKYIIAGVVLMAAISSVTNLFLPLITGENPLAKYGTYSTLLFAGPIAYAIVRHRLFDIRLVATRFLAYALLITGLALIYGIIIAAVALLNADFQLSIAQFIVVTLTSVGLILAAQPLKRFIDRLTRSVFYQDAYDTKEVLDRISAVLVRTVSVKGLSDEVLKILKDAVKAEYAAVVLNGERTIANGKHLPYIGVLLDALKNFRSSVAVLDEIEGKQSHLVTLMSENDAAIIVRLQTSKEKIGYLIFGYKAAGNMYNAQDIGLIKTVASELAIAIQNSLRFEQIEQFNETLQHRVNEATSKLRETNKKLRALDEAKDEFISMASHQMRTPLTSVKGYISMILEGYGGSLKPEQRRLLSEAYNSSQRMVYLIADFLSVSRIRTDKFTLESKPVNLTEVIQDEINQLEVTAQNRGLTLVYNEPSHFPTMLLDEEKVRQVIMNLIDNAIYYTEPGGTVTVILGATAKEVSFRVQDTGIGVPKPQQHKLFTKFFRASNALKMRPDGTGIGLFLAKKIVALQGGAMIFESKEGKGSTFGFSFPREKLETKED